ncbi:MAG TPA: phosphotransferase [Steroidobacteraceae bacterium]|nr:phosphotransferase [Steroidobacteraceae bacterium]
MSSPLDELSEPERLAAFDTLAASAVKAWELEPITLKRIACRENAVYAVELQAGRRLALRVHRHGYHGRASLESELIWMRALAAVNVATAAVVRTPGGHLAVEVTSNKVPVPHFCDMLEWVEGRPLGSAEDTDSLRSGTISDTYRTVGRIAAQIHSHSATWQTPAGFHRPHWDREGCLGRAALWGPWFDLSVLEPAERTLLEAAVKVLEGTFERLGKGREAYGLIHADFVPDNLIEHDGRVVVLDFDDSGYGWYLFELATAVFWYLGGAHYLPALEGYVAGYREVRSMSDEELRLLPQFLLLRALVYMGWMQTRSTQRTARRMTTRVRELSSALARRVVAANPDYRSIAPELSPLPDET